MISQATTLSPEAARQRQPKQAFRVVFLIAGLLILPAALTLRTVVDPGALHLTTENPTPSGYTVSLLFVHHSYHRVGLVVRSPVGP